MHERFIIIGVLLMYSVFCWSQASVKIGNVEIIASCKIQTDILAPQSDEMINTGTYDSKILSNTYGDLILASKYVDAGLRVRNV